MIRFVVSDTLNKHLYTSTDCGATFTAHDLEFVPELVEFDRAHDKLFLVHDLEDTEKRLYVTKNFGETFSHVQVCSIIRYLSTGRHCTGGHGPGLG